MNSVLPMYFLHTLHGHLFICQFLIILLNYFIVSLHSSDSSLSSQTFEARDYRLSHAKKSCRSLISRTETLRRLNSFAIKRKKNR